LEIEHGMSKLFDMIEKVTKLMGEKSESE